MHRRAHARALNTPTHTRVPFRAPPPLTAPVGTAPRKRPFQPACARSPRSAQHLGCSLIGRAAHTPPRLGLHSALGDLSGSKGVPASGACPVPDPRVPMCSPGAEGHVPAWLPPREGSSHVTSYMDIFIVNPTVPGLRVWFAGAPREQPRVAPLFGWVFMTFHPPFCRQLELTSEWTRAPQPALSQRSVVTERPRVAAPEPPVRLRLQPWARVHTPLCGAPAAIPLLQELWVQERL